ncbi:DUF5011 domain-containing protein [Archangium gephyra]|uniref:immunoglobulin-like domain-containing protein n=1 Tax=Archangium gephyra TaxID=48 RepID=UPI0035D4C5DD
MNQRALDEAREGGTKAAQQAQKKGDVAAQGIAGPAIISNGVVQLGVNANGALNVPGDVPSTGSSSTTTVGVRYLPTGGEATAPGCLCEGWGVADAATGVTGWANLAQGGQFNMVVESFDSTATEAKSVVRVGGDIRVTHEFMPSPKTPNLYQVLVTIENVSDITLADVRYTRAMDWDISPNTFSEYVTIQGTATATNLRYANDNGFLSTDPLGSRYPILGEGDFVDRGPSDHGALFDFQFGSVAPGGKVKFKIFYGAAGTESAAYDALVAAKAEVYSFGQSNWDGTGDYTSSWGVPEGTYGMTTGAPHTFIFAFGDVGGIELPPVNGQPTANAGPDQTLQCLVPGSVHTISLNGTASSDPEGSPLTYSWSNGSSVVSTAGAPSLSLPLGSHTFSLVVSDGSMFSEPDSVTVNLLPDVAPTLSLNGPATQSLECRSPYSDPGATANDVCDGNLTGSIVRSGSVDSNAVGSYVLTYNVTDPQGQSASPVSRTVNVSDTLAPSITVIGASSESLECGSSYAEPGATASDACVGSVPVSTSGSVNSGAPGSYTVHYSATDPSGNSSSASRSVQVSDTLAPALALNGPASMGLECGSPFLDPGATASDACVGPLPVTVSGSVNSGAPGSYSLSYSAVDPSGNAASTGRAVQVSDTLAPAISLLGENPVRLECGVSTYAEAGATAADLCAGDLSGALVIDSSGVNAGVEGSYSVTYGVADPSGNSSSAVRAVQTQDSLPPTLALQGAPVMRLECGQDTYVEPGATAADACYGDLTSAIAISGSVDTGTVGSYTLGYSVADGAGHTASQSRTITVVDTTSPVVTVKAPVEMWPPNHKMQPFKLSDCASMADQCDASASIDTMGTITSIYSDEPEDEIGSGDGHTMEDIVISGASSFELRAERQGKGNGRVYGVNFQVLDAAGNKTQSTCFFAVPHDMSGSVAVDDGANAGYTVTASPVLVTR